MFRISIALILFAVFTLAISCGAEAPVDPEQIAERMFEAAQARDYDKMRSYMSTEMHAEFNDAMLDRIEIVSFSVDKIDYDIDSTEVEVEYTITFRELESGDTEVMEDDMELIRTIDGDWIITEM